tara:strand:+ start:81 stop:917 length:837 start_codon:yes stop_codon:yes gene_type:complete
MLIIIISAIIIFLLIIIIESISNNRRNLLAFQNAKYILKKDNRKIKIPEIEETNKIPKKILQIYFQGEDCVPPYVRENITEKNTEWEYNFFDQEKCYNFLRENFDESYVEKMDSFKKYAHKADLFRICWLYINGGVYMDADMELFIPLDELIKDFKGTLTTLKNNFRRNLYEDVISNFFGYKHETLINSFIFSTKGNILVKECIENIMKIDQEDLEDNYPLILFVMQHVLKDKIEYIFFEKSSNSFIPLIKGDMHMYDKKNNRIGNSCYKNYSNGKFK